MIFYEFLKFQQFELNLLRTFLAVRPLASNWYLHICPQFAYNTLERVQVSHCEP
jgi:hypothetical protein